MIPTLYNALLRCTRTDDLAHPVFELTREDLGLWILELTFGFKDQASLEDGVKSVINRLSEHRALLKELAQDSSDYTLHITFSGNDTTRVILPLLLLELAASCGFQIEVYRFE